MKKSILLLSSILLSFSAAQAATSEQTKKAIASYKKALEFEKKGQVVKAINKLEEAVRLSPEFIKARERLSVLSASKGAILYKQKLAALAKVNIESIDLEDATLAVAMKRLLNIVAEHNKKHGTKHVTNLIIMDKKKKLDSKKVTLTLKNVPATVVIDNIMILAGANYKLEPYFVKVRPNN